MAYNEMGIWLNGYMDALQNEEKITKEQLDFLINHLKGMIDDIFRQMQQQIQDDAEIANI